MLDRETILPPLWCCACTFVYPRDESFCARGAIRSGRGVGGVMVVYQVLDLEEKG